MVRKVFISIDDRRGVKAIEYLLNKLCMRSRLRFEVVSLNPCSSKMTRILRAAVKEYDHVNVLTDAETRDPEIVAKDLIEKHNLNSPNVDVIPISPCIENWPCTMLGLKNCDIASCGEGPVKALNEYWRTTHRLDYRKRYLTDVFHEAFKMIKCVNEIPNNRFSSSLKRFIEVLNSLIGNEKALENKL